ncbi:hypothetical protein OUZ56_020456 [Daphnia magna]|uniref:Uncharacterized protein n=1 Tax=Daphnia magna TaxID=35525 RepID=A0ABQ9ZEJ2_9CRUS|nr:hypothetical protein OUZ56_020456 [Daphnia magna]
MHLQAFDMIKQLVLKCIIFFHCRDCYCVAEDSKENRKHVGCEDRNRGSQGTRRVQRATFPTSHQQRMSSSKSGAKGGGKFTHKMYFDPRADQSDAGDYWITDEELRLRQT